jgi:hypothetical protein
MEVSSTPHLVLGGFRPYGGLPNLIANRLKLAHNDEDHE